MLIETKKFLQIMSNNWAFINFYFFTSENFPGIQSKVFKVKTFLIYLQLWLWNFAHFFSYKKIKKKNVVFSSIRVFCRQPEHLEGRVTRPLFEAGGAAIHMTLRACMSMTTRKEELVMRWSLAKGCVDSSKILAI